MKAKMKKNTKEEMKNFLQQVFYNYFDYKKEDSIFLTMDAARKMAEAAKKEVERAEKNVKEEAEKFTADTKEKLKKEAKIAEEYATDAAESAGKYAEEEAKKAGKCFGDVKAKLETEAKAKLDQIIEGAKGSEEHKTGIPAMGPE